jgi:hypothetical protein
MVDVESLGIENLGLYDRWRIDDATCSSCAYMYVLVRSLDRRAMIVLFIMIAYKVS